MNTMKLLTVVLGAILAAHTVVLGAILAAQEQEDVFNCDTNNPCTEENRADGNYYFASTDPQYFVQCDAWGGCFIMPCGPGTVWDQEHLTCNHAPADTEPGCTDGSVETEVVCENRGWAFMACEEHSTLTIRAANYGRTQSSSEVCPYFRRHRDRTDCVSDSAVDKVRAECEGKQSCAVPSANYFFGDTCWGTYKYLSIEYQCVCNGPDTFDCEENNPCSADSIADANSYYFPHHEDEKFVQCDNHGGCFVMTCGPGTRWSDEAKTCVHA